MRKISKYINLVLSLFLIVSIFSVFLCVNNKAYAKENTQNVSIVNINQKGEIVDNFKSAISGEQKSFVYLGSNFEKKVNGNKNLEGAIKWRVLSNNDSKYSNGKMLLWSDKSLGKSKYSLNNAKKGQYWNESYVHALLNGGAYDLGSVTTSWADILLNSVESSCIEGTAKYETLDFGYNITTAPYVYTNDLVGDGNGQYKNADVENAKATINGTSVVENTIGDKLFLLDYQDINNPLYGFSDGKNTYATSIKSDWKYNQGVYPVNFDNRDIKFAPLAFDYSSDNSSVYWLRPTGVDIENDALSLVVGDTGFVTVAGVNNNYGIRPAMNFDSSNVVYATAANFNGSSTAVNVEEKSNDYDYKLFIKSNDFVNFNGKANAPKLTAGKNTLSIQTENVGKAVLLLNSKNDDGKVSYQAVAEIKDGVASYSIPKSIATSNYNATILFVDAVSSDKSSVVVNGSYTSTYPIYIANEYQVDFYDDDNNIISSVEIKKDTVIGKDNIPANPIKQGDAQYSYTFDGWYNGDVKWNMDTDKVNSDIVLTAKFNQTINKYKVTFDGKNEVELEYGKLVDKPADPQKTEDEKYTYTFDGWYNGDIKWDFEKYKVEQDMDLKAVFTKIAKKFKVTFDGKNEVELEYGDHISAPQVPQKADDEKYSYIFDGWYNGNEKWNFNNDVVNSDINLTSKFIETLKEYKVIISFEGLDKEMVIKKLKYGDTIDFSTFNADGYTFKVSVDGKEVSSINVEKNMNIIVTYTPVKKGGCGSTINASTITMIMLIVLAISCLFIKKSRA